MLGDDIIGYVMQGEYTAAESRRFQQDVRPALAFRGDQKGPDCSIRLPISSWSHPGRNLTFGRDNALDFILSKDSASLHPLCALLMRGVAHQDERKIREFLGQIQHDLRPFIIPVRAKP